MPDASDKQNLSLSQRCLLIFVLGCLGGWLGYWLAGLFAAWLATQFSPLTAADVPGMARHAWLAAIFYNFFFIGLMYISIQAIMRWQVLRSAQHYRSLLRASGLLERIRSGTADYGLAQRVLAKQPPLIQARFREYPAPLGDPYLDIGHIGLFLDLHLEAQREQALYLRPAPVFLIAPFVANFIGLASHQALALLPPELSIYNGGLLLSLIVTVLLVSDQLQALGLAWHRMLLSELGPEFRAELQRREAQAASSGSKTATARRS